MSGGQKKRGTADREAVARWEYVEVLSVMTHFLG